MNSNKKQIIEKPEYVLTDTEITIRAVIILAVIIGSVLLTIGYFAI